MLILFFFLYGFCFSAERFQSVSDNTELQEEIELNSEIDKMTENGLVHFTLGDESREQDDIFPQNGDTMDSLPPAAPSDGQGGLSLFDQMNLVEKRKRLK